MATFTLPLSDLFDVSVSISPQAPATPAFNQALIVGTSAVVPSVGPNSRCVQFTGSTILTQMITYGFSLTDPEYLAATWYMSQSPAPNFLWIGRQNLTAINTAIPTSGNIGTGYVVGDIILVASGMASGGYLRVSSIGSNGTVTGLATIAGEQGTGYSVATGLATSGGSGTGLEVDITVLGETPLQAVQACRVASISWYLVYAIAAVDTDNIAIVEYAQSAVPQMDVFFSTATPTVLVSTTTTDIFSVLKAGLYNRYQGVYSTIQGGLAPNNAYFAAGLMGVAMGLNTGLANSYYTLAYKGVIGMTAEPLTQAQFNTVQTKNGNAYINFSNTYNWYQNSKTGSGQYFDQILGLDMLASDIQFGCANLLNSAVSIPQTDGGQSQLIHAVNQACQLSVARGFLAAGIWEGATIINLSAGQSLTSGYLAQSYPIATQTPADRAARKAMPIYVAIILAGSMQSLTIAVYVQQ